MEKQLNTSLEVDVMEIKTDVKWIKQALEKGHECKKESIISVITNKIDTNRRLILFLLSAMLITYIPFILNLFK